MTESPAAVSTSKDDEPPELSALRDEVWERLASRRLSSRWFYDRRGSELFEQITQLEEYYPTRTELALLEEHAPAWLDRLRPGAIVELGAGSARKTRVLLDALVEVRPDAVYIPLDVSAEFLRATAEAIREEYPALEVIPEVGDLTRPLQIEHRATPTLFVLLGSTLGNFTPSGAVEVLGHIRAAMADDDLFLMGADLRPGPGKTVAELEAAYDDALGVTADFNRNMLHVLNARAGTDFDPESFEHRAFYDPGAGWVEMHLVAPQGATVRVPGRGIVELGPGESLRTEISSKYDRATLDRLFSEAGLQIVEEVRDPAGRYTMVFARRGVR